MPYKNKEDLYKAQRRHREKVSENLLNFLKTKRCIDCGESDPIVLEFNHKNRSLKSRGIAKMLSGHFSWNSVEKEIRKCEIRCANCHRRKTYIQLNCFGRGKISP